MVIPDLPEKIPSLTANDSRPQPADEDEPTVQPTPRHTTELPTLPAVSDAPTFTNHGLTGGKARVWTNDNTSPTRHNTSTRVLDETANCGIERQIRWVRRF